MSCSSVNIVPSWLFTPPVELPVIYHPSRIISFIGRRRRESFSRLYTNRQMMERELLQQRVCTSQGSRRWNPGVFLAWVCVSQAVMCFVVVPCMYIKLACCPGCLSKTKMRKGVDQQHGESFKYEESCRQRANQKPSTNQAKTDKHKLVFFLKKNKTRRLRQFFFFLLKKIILFYFFFFKERKMKSRRRFTWSDDGVGNRTAASPPTVCTRKSTRGLTLDAHTHIYIYINIYTYL